MRAMKHKPSLLEECGSTRLPALNCASALSLQLQKKNKNQRYVDGGPSVRPPPEETQRGVFLITSISELSPVVI